MSKFGQFLQMAWAPTIDTGIGSLGLILTVLGVWVSWKSLREAELAKNAAAGAEAAAKDARDSVRREDRKAKLITKLTQLLSTTNEIRSHDESLFEAVCEPKLVDLRRELVACAHAASGNYPTINDQLKVAATLLDDIDQQRQGDAADVIAIRKRLLINVGNTISGLHSALELGTYDDG